MAKPALVKRLERHMIENHISQKEIGEAAGIGQRNAWWLLNKYQGRKRSNVALAVENYLKEHGSPSQRQKNRLPAPSNISTLDAVKTVLALPNKSADDRIALAFMIMGN